MFGIAGGQNLESRPYKVEMALLNLFILKSRAGLQLGLGGIQEVDRSKQWTVVYTQSSKYLNLDQDVPPSMPVDSCLPKKT